MEYHMSVIGGCRLVIGVSREVPHVYGEVYFHTLLIYL